MATSDRVMIQQKRPATYDTRGSVSFMLRASLRSLLLFQNDPLAELPRPSRSANPKVPRTRTIYQGLQGGCQVMAMGSTIGMYHVYHLDALGGRPLTSSACPDSPAPKASLPGFLWIHGMLSDPTCRPDLHSLGSF